MKYSMWHCRAQLCFHIHKPYASVDCQLAASGIVLQNSLSPPPAFSLSFISSFLWAEWRFGPLDIWTHYTLSLSFSQLLRMTANTTTHRLTDASPQELWAIFRPFLFSTPFNEILCSTVLSPQDFFCYFCLNGGQSNWFWFTSYLHYWTAAVCVCVCA